MVKMMRDNLLFYVGVGLVAFGILQPDLNNLPSVLNNRPSVNVSVDISKPTNQELLLLCDPIIESLRSGGSSRHTDGKKLASLYHDIATLISLDNDNLAIKNTQQIREANRMSGNMLKLDMKGKYSNLASSCDKLVKTAIGDDNIVLSPELRSKSAEAFMAIAWACNEGSK